MIMIKLFSFVILAFVAYLAILIVLHARDNPSDAGSRGFALVGSETAILAGLPGCHSEETLDRIRGLINAHDVAAEWKLLTSELDGGNCRLFTKGERVFVEDRAILSGEVAIHGIGDPNTFWVPSAAVDPDPR
jgi:hypothetical protein